MPAFILGVYIGFICNEPTRLFLRWAEWKYGRSYVNANKIIR